MSLLALSVLIVLEILLLSAAFMIGQKRKQAQFEPRLGELQQQLKQNEEKLQQAQADKQALAELKYQHGQLQRDHQALLQRQS